MDLIACLPSSSDSLSCVISTDDNLIEFTALAIVSNLISLNLTVCGRGGGADSSRRPAAAHGYAGSSHKTNRPITDLENQRCIFTLMPYFFAIAIIKDSPMLPFNYKPLHNTRTAFLSQSF